MNKLNTILLISGALLAGSLSSCNEGDDDDVSLEIPSTYEFTRDGASTVDYSGQTARLDMLAELKAYIGTANDGAVLSEEVLLDMFANENNPFSSAELNESGKQLKDKTFAADVTFFSSILASAASASASETGASQGKAGLISREPIGRFCR